MHKIPTPIQDCHASMLPLATHNNPPVPISALPSSCRVTEGTYIHPLARNSYRVVIRFHPFTEIWVEEVCWDGVVLDLKMLGVKSYVENNWLLTSSPPRENQSETLETEYKTRTLPQRSREKVRERERERERNADIRVNPNREDHYSRSREQ
jgi:hypothetical protein